MQDTQRRDSLFVGVPSAVRGEQQDNCLLKAGLASLISNGLRTRLAISHITYTNLLHLLQFFQDIFHTVLEPWGTVLDGPR